MIGRQSLIAAGIGLICGALLHVAALVGGPEWIAFLGAPESVVLSARDGTWIAPVTILGIAATLGIWALYAFSGAGWLRRLPLLRIVLAGVAGLFVLRGLLIVPMLTQANLMAAFDLFHVATSLVVLVIGCLLAIGAHGLRTTS